MGIAQRHDAAALLARAVDSQGHGFLAHHLAETGIAVQTQQRAGIQQHAHPGIRFEVTLEVGSGIAWQHADAMRIVASEVGLDEVAGHGFDLGRVAAKAAHHQAHGIVQTVQGNGVGDAHAAHCHLGL